MCCSPEVTQLFRPAHERGSAGMVGSAGHIGQEAQQLASQGQGLCTELGMPRAGGGDALLSASMLDLLMPNLSCSALGVQGGSRSFLEALTWLRGQQFLCERLSGLGGQIWVVQVPL